MFFVVVIVVSIFDDLDEKLFIACIKRIKTTKKAQNEETIRVSPHNKPLENPTIKEMKSFG